MEGDPTAVCQDREPLGIFIFRVVLRGRGSVLLTSYGGEMTQRDRMEREIRRQKAKGDTLAKCLIAITVLTPEQLEQVEMFLDGLEAEGRTA